MTKRLRVGRMVVVCGSVVIVLLGVLTSVTSAEEIQRLLLDYKVLTKSYIIPGSSKVSSNIQTVIAEANARGVTRQNVKALGVSALSTPLVKVSEEGGIQTYVHVYSSKAEDMVLLESYGVSVEIVNEKLGIIQAWIPFDKIYEIAQLPFVKRITPPSYGIPSVGSVTTEGDAILKADSVRALGYDGSGVKVGVISDGALNRGAAQATGDLPPSVTIVTSAGSGDEGTAMLEIVHDLAPGADLGFCGLPNGTTLEFIQCVNDLAGVFSANVIVDDIGFFGEPYFEDGPVAQTVRNVLTNVVYASSAGNSAQGHYEGSFRGVSWQGGNAHDFGKAAGGGSDPTMNVLIGAGSTMIVVLQWNDRFGTSGNDYDLYLINDAEDTIIAASTEIQNGDDNPIEALGVTNTGTSAGRVKVVIVKYSGDDKLLEMFLIGGQVEQYNVRGGSVFGHQAVTGVLATAAIAANDPGNDTIEPFSSLGPSQIFFPAQETRQKPDITAIDGVSVTGAGGFPSPFYGTSAAAPHVAGMAALLKEVYQTATAADIVAALKKGAVDLGPPGTDSTFGAGLVNALSAALPPPSGLAAVAVSPGQINLTWTDNSTNEESFRVERKTGSGGIYSEVVTAVANATSFNDTGVSEATTYFYRVRAHNSTLDSSYSNEANALTYPAAPSGLTATSASSTQINLTWTDNSSGESGFRIERKVDAGGTYSVRVTPAANVTSYSDTGLSPSTTYFYRVHAYNASGNSTFSNEVSATTSAATPSGGGGGGGGGCFISTVESH